MLFDYLTKFVAYEWFFNLVECDLFLLLFKKKKIFGRKMLNVICEWVVGYMSGSTIKI